MTLLFQATWILPIILASVSSCLASLDVPYEWKYIDYLWEKDCQKAAAIKAGTYDRTKIIPNDVQPVPDGRILVTTPRYFNNPASLSTISEETGDGGPLLAPYPDWSWHNRKDCSGITSVNRIRLDKYNRLWIVDSGKIGNEQICPAKILAFDSETDELIQEVEIPMDLTHSPDDESQGRLEISGIEKDGAVTYVYIADPEGNGLVISDGTDIWRLNSYVFGPDPNYTIFSIDGDNFTLSIGLTSFHITPDGYLEKPSVMFKAMSAVNSFGVTLEDLHNSKSGADINMLRLNFTEPSQELAGSFSVKNGVFLATFSTETLLACWNIENPLQPEHIGFLVTDATNLQFPSGLKITLNADSESQTVTMMTNRYQRVVLNTMNFDEVNFRVVTGDVDTLVSGTVCEPTEGFEIKNSLLEKNFFVWGTISNALSKSHPISSQK